MTDPYIKVVHSPKNYDDYLVVIYSTLSCSKPVWVSFFC